MKMKGKIRVLTVIFVLIGLLFFDISSAAALCEQHDFGLSSVQVYVYSDGRPWDLRKFFSMEDPQEAAKALKEHAEKYGISFDAHQPTQQTEVPNGSSKKPEAKPYEPLIQVFNGSKFTPPPGMEDALVTRAGPLDRRIQT